MQALFDSPEIRRGLMELKSHALANTLDLREVTDPKTVKIVGDDPRHCFLNGTTRIVYSVEIQPDPRLGQCHHLSISKTGDRPPAPELVDYVMGQLGMGHVRDGNAKRHLSLEHGFAVNIIQSMS